MDEEDLRPLVKATEVWSNKLTVSCNGKLGMIAPSHQENCFTVYVICKCGKKHPREPYIVSLDSWVLDHCGVRVAEDPACDEDIAQHCMTQIKVHAPGQRHDKKSLQEYVVAVGRERGGPALAGNKVWVYWWQQEKADPGTRAHIKAKAAQAVPILNDDIGVWYVAEVVGFDDDTGQFLIWYLSDKSIARVMMDLTFLHWGKNCPSQDPKSVKHRPKTHPVLAPLISYTDVSRPTPVAPRAAGFTAQDKGAAAAAAAAGPSGAAAKQSEPPSKKPTPTPTTGAAGTSTKSPAKKTAAPSPTTKAPEVGKGAPAQPGAGNKKDKDSKDKDKEKTKDKSKDKDKGQGAAEGPAPRPGAAPATGATKTGGDREPLKPLRGSAVPVAGSEAAGAGRSAAAAGGAKAKAKAASGCVSLSSASTLSFSSLQQEDKAPPAGHAGKAEAGATGKDKADATAAAAAAAGKKPDAPKPPKSGGATTAAATPTATPSAAPSTAKAGQPPRAPSPSATSGDKAGSALRGARATNKSAAILRLEESVSLESGCVWDPVADLAAGLATTLSGQWGQLTRVDLELVSASLSPGDAARSAGEGDAVAQLRAPVGGKGGLQLQAWQLPGDAKTERGVCGAARLRALQLAQQALVKCAGGRDGVEVVQGALSGSAHEWPWSTYASSGAGTSRVAKERVLYLVQPAACGKAGGAGAGQDTKRQCLEVSVHQQAMGKTRGSAGTPVGTPAGPPASAGRGRGRGGAASASTAGSVGGGSSTGVKKATLPPAGGGGQPAAAGSDAAVGKAGVGASGGRPATPPPPPMENTTGASDAPHLRITVGPWQLHIVGVAAPGTPGKADKEKGGEGRQHNLRGRYVTAEDEEQHPVQNVFVGLQWVRPAEWAPGIDKQTRVVAVTGALACSLLHAVAVLLELPGMQVAGAGAGAGSPVGQGESPEATAERLLGCLQACHEYVSKVRNGTH